MDEVDLVQPAQKPQPGGEPGQPGGEPGQPGGEPGQPGGEPGQPGGEPGQPGGEPGQPGGEWEDQEKIHKDIEDKLAKREEIGSDEEAEKKKKEAEAKKPGSSIPGMPGTGGKMDLRSREAEIVRITPKFNWKTLIKNLVTASVQQTDISYAKPSRRAVTGISIAAQIGAGALKPGEKVMEEHKAKLVFVFDTSGSMAAQVPRVMAEVRNLLKQLGKSDVDMGVVFFAGEHKSFIVNMGTDSYSQVPTILDVGKPLGKGDRKKGYKHVFGMGAAGGTEFTQSMTADLAALAAQGFNILIFSDTDIADSTNFKHLRQLWQSHKDKVFLVAVDELTFKTVCGLLGVVPRTFTYLT